MSALKRPWGTKTQKVGARAATILRNAKSLATKSELLLQKPVIPHSANYVMFDCEGLPPQLDELDKVYLWGLQVFGETPAPWAMAKYIEATETEDENTRSALMNQILNYNREDLEATWAVLKWLNRIGEA